MIPRVTTAEYVRDYVIHVRFADGVEGDVDLQDELDGEVFEPLRDPAISEPLRSIPTSTRLPGRMVPTSPRSSSTRKSKSPPDRLRRPACQARKQLCIYDYYLSKIGGCL
jgi:hypothetical protein